MPNIVSAVIQIFSDKNTIVIAGLTIVSVTSLILLLMRYAKDAQQLGGDLGDVQKKSDRLLYDAAKQAQNIIGLSELEGIKVSADAKIATQKMEKESLQALQEVSIEAKSSMQKAQSTFVDYLSGLSQQANASVTESEKVVKDRVSQLFEQFEQNLSTYLTQTQEQSVKAITLEVQAARQLIDSYKTEQFRLIDENIVAMLERTLSLVLTKNLTLKDQVDLVYESLEKAKAEKFIM